jgi:hypothetical protein
MYHHIHVSKLPQFDLYKYTDHEMVPGGVNILSAVRGEDKACRWTGDFLLVSAKVT